jgi:DNA helicase II / ATP-dependent DNA helicase PcrA
MTTGEGVPVVIYQNWVQKLRRAHFPLLPREVADDTPGVVSKLKKSPAILVLINEHVRALERKLINHMLDAVTSNADREVIERAFRDSGKHALGVRLEALSRWAQNERSLSPGVRRAIQTTVSRYGRSVSDVITAWSEMLTDQGRVREVFMQHAAGELSASELEQAHQWCARRCPVIVTEWEEHVEEGTSPRSVAKDADEPEGRHEPADDAQQARAESGHDSDHGNQDDDDEVVTPDQPTGIDHEDESILLLLHQRLRGPLSERRGKEPLEYEHILIDEAQDLSPVELSVVVSTTTPQRSLTLAGDVAQRLHMDNGFNSWSEVLSQLDLSHVEVEPLKLSYRSTYEIIEFAHQALGPIAPKEMGRAMRSGAPVELFRFAHSGDAVGFLAESLRDLARAEPRSSVAVIARYPEQADLYFRGLVNAEVPNVRRVADQDFAFKPGIDVTDVRQVKGLEFDYVVLVEVNESTYPTSDEARHLLHIASTRAAHQLWLSCSGTPSQLIPQLLRERGY